MSATSKPTVAQAKADLLRFGDEQSVRLSATITTWTDRIRHAAPFAAAAAAGMGFFFGRRKRAPAGRYSWLFNIARAVAPLVVESFLRPKPRRDESPHDTPPPT